MAETKGTCDGCGKMKDRLAGWKGKRLCATCVNLASAVRNHRDTVDRLYTMIHGSELVAAQDVEPGGPEIDYLHEVVASVNDALGGGYTSGDLAGAIRELKQRAAVMTSAVQVAEDHGTECDPHNCEELRAAMEIVLDVSTALRGAFAEQEKPGVLAREVAEIIADRDRLRAELDLARGGYVARIQEIAEEDRYEVALGYESLMQVLVAAHNQAANGKGRERHASGEPFEQQKICEITRRVGLGYPLGQAIKKAIEAQRLGALGPAELLGAIVYLAAAHIVMREEGSVEQEAGSVNVVINSGSVLPASGLVPAGLVP